MYELWELAVSNGLEEAEKRCQRNAIEQFKKNFEKYGLDYFSSRRISESLLLIMLQKTYSNFKTADDVLEEMDAAQM
jgi:hypothetical protein